MKKNITFVTIVFILLSLYSSVHAQTKIIKKGAKQNLLPFRYQ